MLESGTIVNDWVCRVCGNTVRGQVRPPSNCPRCHLGVFGRIKEGTASPSQNGHPILPEPAPPRAGQPVSLDDDDSRPFTSTPHTTGPHRGCRPAKRIRPNEPLEVRLARSTSLEALDISATGLLVEYARPFPPGSICEVELWRSSQGIRFRAEVVRSVVSAGGKGSQTGIRYRTAVHFLETPQTIFTLLPELSEAP